MLEESSDELTCLKTQRLLSPSVSGIAVAVNIGLAFPLLPRRCCRTGFRRNRKSSSTDAVSELANIITGQTSIIIAGESDKIDIIPPAVFGGRTSL
ncbi:chemotaxis protein CheC [Marispirochaeta sp.]|uniref:chemotaxis protein CheC n=1 Tax=Marispirochaeta sp. TaxID=2038653 RepID=UPI0029C95A3D|nr:chemotaxis protein CheC [Marispirochaeta sp.]